MTRYFPRVLTSGLLLALAACSGEESVATHGTGSRANDDSVAPIDAVAKFVYAHDMVGRSPPKVSLAGEYANFSKKCSPHVPLIGAINYPRKLEKFSNSAETIPRHISNSENKACPLHLVSIQVDVVDSTGVEVAGAATNYDLSKAGTETFSCYSAIGGPGYCLVNSPLSARAREAGRKRLVGNIQIKWRH